MHQSSNKVAAVTPGFWVMKICATTLGETGGDLLSMTLGIGYARSTILLMSCFVVVLSAQLFGRRFRPSLYWLTILATSTAGTTMSDFMDRTLALGYATGTTILLSTLACVLVAWRLTEGTLSVSHIETRRAEIFYWGAILVSNTLGTALGDYLADDSGWGFLGAAAVIGATIAACAILYLRTGLSRVALFWVAFVLTRPFGATLGDLMTKPPGQGGVGFGTVGSSGVLVAVMVVAFVVSQRLERAERLSVDQNR